MSSVVTPKSGLAWDCFDSHVKQGNTLPVLEPGCMGLQFPIFSLKSDLRGHPRPSGSLYPPGEALRAVLRASHMVKASWPQVQQPKEHSKVRDLNRHPRPRGSAQRRPVSQELCKQEQTVFGHRLWHSLLHATIY